MSKFVNVVITRQTQATSQKGFGMPLIFTGDKVAAYKEYAGDTAVADVGVDFGTSSKTYKLAAKIMGQTPKPERIAIHGILFKEGTTAVGAMATALNALILEHNDWFYLTSTLQADASITALAQWVATQEKLYFASTANKTLANTLNNLNVALLVHPNPDTYPAEAWVGVGAPQTVGSFTWTFKTLNGIDAAGYNATDVALIENNKASTYIREGGVNITSNGVVTSGDYIDIIQSQYYIKSRMIENVFGLLVRSPKVPFTDTGIGLVVAEVEKTLKEAFNNGIIADEEGEPMFTVTAPTRSEVATNDKANRVLPNIKWSATIAGAVEKVKINGTLQL